MPENAVPPSPEGSPLPDKKLVSWKEIAAYLGREVRTVQRWENTEGLPVHRHEHLKKSTVYAYASELAAVHVGLGEKDEAFKLLEIAYQKREDRLIYLRVEPMADPIRSDPRFAQLLAKIGVH
jgi:hypothetical protein